MRASGRSNGCACGSADGRTSDLASSPTGARPGERSSGEKHARGRASEREHPRASKLASERSGGPTCERNLPEEKDLDRQQGGVDLNECGTLDEKLVHGDDDDKGASQDQSKPEEDQAPPEEDQAPQLFNFFVFSCSTPSQHSKLVLCLGLEIAGGAPAILQGLMFSTMQ